MDKLEEARLKLLINIVKEILLPLQQKPSITDEEINKEMEQLMIMRPVVKELCEGRDDEISKTLLELLKNSGADMLAGMLESDVMNYSPSLSNNRAAFRKVLLKAGITEEFTNKFIPALFTYRRLRDKAAAF